MELCQHGTESQLTLFNILWNRCHDESRLFWEQREALFQYLYSVPHNVLSECIYSIPSFDYCLWETDKIIDLVNLFIVHIWLNSRLCLTIGRQYVLHLPPVPSTDVKGDILRGNKCHIAGIISLYIPHFMSWSLLLRVLLLPGENRTPDVLGGQRPTVINVYIDDACLSKFSRSSENRSQFGFVTWKMFCLIVYQFVKHLGIQ